MSKDNSPIILAFSGGLDTSFCVPWLKENYDRDVVTACVDTGGIDPFASLWVCGRVRIPADRPEQRRVDNLWTARPGHCKQQSLLSRGPQVDHTLGPLAHIPTGSTTNCF